MTDGGDWVVIQRRSSAEVDFYRDWNDYVTGFGDLDGNFWFGLENIYRLCSRSSCELRVDMVWKGGKYYAKYSNFRLSSPGENF